MRNISAQGKKCYGCSACVQICPKKAITMKPDSITGSLYPNVNTELCILCGLCLKACPLEYAPEPSILKTFAAISNCTDPRKSASGGAFSALATKFLENGGIVYGSALLFENNQIIIKHIGINAEENLHLLQGSKYVQSDINGVYSEIEASLKENKTVLFSGTPCQVAGLKSYLGKSYEHLFLVEIVCHGVPSSQFFNDYIKSIENRTGKTIIDFSFRDKSEGWKLHGKILLKDDKGNIESRFFEPSDSSYYKLFLDGVTYRENCYSCPYASKNRAGDITLGDFWNIDLVHPELLSVNGGVFEERKGISCLVINNSKGEELISKYNDALICFQSDYDMAAKYNGQLVRPSTRNERRGQVFELYKNKGYAAVEQMHKQWLRKYRMKKKLIGLIPKPIKNIRRYVISMVGKFNYRNEE